MFKADVSPMLSMAASQGGQLRGPRWLGTCVCLLVGESGAQVVPGDNAGYWWTESDSRVSCCRVLGVLEIVLA